MTSSALVGVWIPFVGTTLGAACVFVLRHSLKDKVQRALTGFAAGVMVAASIWSLLIPAMEQAEALGIWAFLPAVTGFWIGVGFMLLLDHVVPHLHQNSEEDEGIQCSFCRSVKLTLAVTLHNIPEGMAVGAVFAGLLNENTMITFAGAAALSLGIAIQNFPEGAILSLPLHADGLSRPKAFWYGVLSGVVEPIAAILTILAAEWLVPALPVLLSFAAGAMLYVVVEELIPEMSAGKHSHAGVLAFMLGFTVMMILDVVLG